MVRESPPLYPFTLINLTQKHFDRHCRGGGGLHPLDSATAVYWNVARVTLASWMFIGRSHREDVYWMPVWPMRLRPRRYLLEDHHDSPVPVDMNWKIE